MRITNVMMNNTTLININRNMRNLDNIIQSIESGKKIQVPSDNPIIASRALKFRTNISEIYQFQRNVLSGMAWMEVSESPLMTLTQEIFIELKGLLVEGATGHEEYSPDKLAIIAKIRELVDQIGVGMNQTYAGRYVFSGFRTNEPAVLIENNDKSYNITQNFSMQDIERTIAFHKPSNYEKADEHSVNILKMAYKDLDAAPTLTVKDANGNLIPGFTVSPTEFTLNDSNAYTPAPGTVHYIKTTGELVFNPEDVKNLPNDAVMEVNYEKTGFNKGELNPLVYFSVVDNATGNSYNMDDQDMQYEFTTNTYITINALAKNVYTDKMYADFQRLIEFAESLQTSLSDPEVLRQHYASPAGGGLTGSNLDNAVTAHITEEKALLNAMLQNRFNNMLDMYDRHTAVATKEYTQMGTRMYRLELLQIRLEEDEGAYTKLMSENEDTNLAHAIMLRAAAEAAFTASLRASSNIMQLSLANFI